MTNDLAEKQIMPTNSNQVFDIVVIGGGINGCGVARDAAGRGLSVCLLEMNDLASATSSSSSKMIHGGLRYLENYEFRLVREALKEREVLLEIAPHLVSPLSFVFPHVSAMRPTWMIRLGLFLYDNLYRRRILHGSKSIDLRTNPVGVPLEQGYTKAFIYSDARVDDARLVILNAVDAAERGAVIATRTRCISASRVNNSWHIVTSKEGSGKQEVIFAKALINASGPWVKSLIEDCLDESSKDEVRLVKGSHIVVPKLFDHDKAYILQNTDQRIVFAIPYQRRYTLIGTTDVDFRGDPSKVFTSNDEIDYLCEVVNLYFRRKVKRSDVIWKYAGVRPLYHDGVDQAQNVTRDYVLKLTDQDELMPVLHIFGGKITTYRKLAEAVLDKLQNYFPAMTGSWTTLEPLPGGTSLSNLSVSLMQSHGFLGQDRIDRLIAAYGSRVWKLLENVNSEIDMGRTFGAGLTACEVKYLMENEFARNAADVLWRRGKLGLVLSEAQVLELDSWMAGKYDNRNNVPNTSAAMSIG